MNPTYNYQQNSDCDKRAEMETFLQGTYWENDAWISNDPFFNQYKIRGDVYSYTRRIIFSEYPDVFRLELKYYLARRISDRMLLISTICLEYRATIRLLVNFLNKFYPDLHSFSDKRLEGMEPQWIEHLRSEGYKMSGSSRYKFEALMRQIHSFFSDFYDTRNEFEKDIWDCRKIPGVNIPVNAANYKINFMTIPHSFRELAQRYIKLRLTTRSMSHARRELDALAQFFQFLSAKEPNWMGLQELTRRHIEEFLVHYLGKYNVKTDYVIDRLIYLMNFLQRIQQFGYPDAPLVPASSLLYREDFPRPLELSPMSDRIKYIPDGIMVQLKKHLEYLTPPEYIPVVIILMASGWRASDVFGLKYDTCLEYTEQGWYLLGDIPKTHNINHRVPITNEVKAVVETVAQIAKDKSTPDNNPQRLLFNRYKGKRLGRAPYNNALIIALNRLATEYNITDAQGNIYKFNVHSFRHTKGVELINSGMKLENVQKWMCHVSPEMTLVYAKILDTTLRKSWEQTVKNGIFRMTDSGHIKKIDISNIESEDLIEWEYIRCNLDAVRMPLGFCMKPNKQDCFTQLNPCLTCRNLCTTPDFLPQYELEVQETKVLIERGKTQGREIWVEKNQYLLEQYEEIITVLKTGKTHHTAGKKGREYLGEERENVK